MTLVNEDMSNILDYLSRNEIEFDEINSKSDKMESFHTGALLVSIFTFHRT